MSLKKIAIAFLTLACPLSGFQESHGAVVVSGSKNVLFTDPGVYDFDFTISSTEVAPITITGFTLALQDANGATPIVNTDFTDFLQFEYTANPFLENKAASSDFIGAGFGFSITSVDNNGSPLVLNPGESTLLFSIPMNVLTTGDVLLENPALAGLTTLASPGFPSGVPFEFSGAATTAVPEPSTFALLGVAGCAALMRRKRKTILA